MPIAKTAFTVHTTISRHYVPDWGFWEGVRELLQNSLDQDEMEYEVVPTADPDSSFIKISNKGYIPKQMLALGVSSSRGDESKTGQHGEGFKLALLVLIREGYPVHVTNGLDKWVVSFQDHPELETEVLSFEIHPGFYDETECDAHRVCVVVKNVRESDLEVLDKKYIPKSHMEDDSDSRYPVAAVHEGNYIFRLTNDDPEINNHFDSADLRTVRTTKDSPKSVYVNGLWVCDLDDKYVFSYNYRPNRLKLDRDRGTVDTWELQEQVSEVLTESENFPLLVAMSEVSTPDLNGYYHASTYKRTRMEEFEGKTQEEVVSDLAEKRFLEKHGENAYPVNAENSADKNSVIMRKVEAAGMIPVIVPSRNFQMLPEEMKEMPVGSFSVIHNKTKALEDFYNTHKKSMKGKVKEALLTLIDNFKMTGY